MTEQIIEIGRRLYALRDSMEFSTAEIAKAMNISQAEYEAYEKGQKDFSFSFLHNAAEILGVDVLDIISGESPKLSRCSVVRNGRGYEIARREAYDYRHLAFTFRDKKAEPFLVTIEPKPEEAEPDKHAHEGQEFNYVLTGQIRFYIGDEIYELSEGDSMYFNSGIRHAMRAMNNQPATFLAVVMK